MLGGEAEAIAARLDEAWSQGLDLPGALQVAVAALVRPRPHPRRPTTSRSPCSTAPPTAGPSAASSGPTSRRCCPRSRHRSRRGAEPPRARHPPTAPPTDRLQRAPRRRPTPVACRRWSGASSASRTSTASRARCAASAGSAPTRSPATCSAGSCRGAAAPTCSSPTAPGCTSTSAPTPSTPPPSATRIYDLVVHDKAGERILEQLLASAEQRLARGGHPRRHLPVQEQHRLGRQLLRLPRELPHEPARRLRPLRRGADPVPREPPDLRRRRQGAADRPGRHVLHLASGPSTSGRACRRPPPAAGRSSTPATSPTPTPSATAASTSSSATRT